MRKKIRVLLCAALLLALTLPSFASFALAQEEKDTVTLTPAEVGFDLGEADAEQLALVPETRAAATTITRSQLDNHLTFEAIVLTDMPVDVNPGFTSEFFRVHDFTGVQVRRSVTTREIDGREYYVWRMTIPTTSLANIASQGVTRYSFVFSSAGKQKGAEAFALATQFTLILHFVDDMADVESSATGERHGTFRVGQDVYVVGVRESLNVRVLPHAKTAAVGRVDLGEKVTLLDWDNSGEWAKILFRDGHEGFVPFENLAHEP